MTSDYEQSGIPADPAGVRISRMAESLAVLKALWSTGEATYQGEHYQVDRSRGDAQSRSSGPIRPIIIGGGGQRVLGIAAREADIVGVNPSLAAGYIGPEVLETTTAEYYHQRIDWIRQAAGDPVRPTRTAGPDVPGPGGAGPGGRHRPPGRDARR